MVALAVKNLPAKAGDTRDLGLITGLEKPPGEGNGTPLQYSGLENSTVRGVWWATVHRVTKSHTRLKRLSTHAVDTHIHTQIHIHVLIYEFLRSLTCEVWLK